MTRTRPISIQPRVNAGCGAAVIGLFGLIFLGAGLVAAISVYASGQPLFNLLFSLPFVAFGLFAIGAAVVMVRPSRAGGRHDSPAGSLAASGGLPQGFVTGTATPSGPIVLRTGMRRLGRLVGMLVICLFWNGLTGLFTWVTYIEKADSGWGIRLFLIPFQLVGLLVLWGVISHALALLNPRPTLTLSGATRLGESLTVQWQMAGRVRRLSSLRIDLVGKEEASFRRGTDTVRDTHIFHRSLVAEARDEGRMERGMASVAVPAGTMHSFTATNNKIVWALEVSGEIGWWPDLEETFEITVTP